MSSCSENTGHLFIYSNYYYQIHYFSIAKTQEREGKRVRGGFSMENPEISRFSASSYINKNSNNGYEQLQSSVPNMF